VTALDPDSSSIGDAALQQAQAVQNAAGSVGRGALHILAIVLPGSNPA